MKFRWIVYLGAIDFELYFSTNSLKVFSQCSSIISNLSGFTKLTSVSCRSGEFCI